MNTILKELLNLFATTDNICIVHQGTQDIYQNKNEIPDKLQILMVDNFRVNHALKCLQVNLKDGESFLDDWRLMRDFELMGRADFLKEHDYLNADDYNQTNNAFVKVSELDPYVVQKLIDKIDYYRKTTIDDSEYEAMEKSLSSYCELLVNILLNKGA